MISKREIKDMIRIHHNGEVSDDSVEMLVNVCNELAQFVVELAYDEFEGYNLIRKKNRLPELKRFTIPVGYTILNNYLNSFVDEQIGDTGEINRKTVLSEAGVEFQ